LPAQISSSAYEVLIDSVTVARFIHPPFQQIRDDLRDTKLTNQLNDQEDRQKLTAEFERGIWQMRALVEETTATAAKGEEVIADLTADAENPDLTKADREVYDEILTKLKILV
jgi:hypothetical protein